MIQRIQSLWLSLAAVAGLLSLKFPFYTGNLVADNTYVKLTAVENIPILILTVLSIVLSVITIFLFRQRKKQTNFTLLNIFISIIVIVLYILQLKNFSQGSFSLACLFVFAMPVFLILALVGIRRDEKIIKSLDRLR